MSTVLCLRETGRKHAEISYIGVRAYNAECMCVREQCLCVYVEARDEIKYVRSTNPRSVP